MPITKSRINIDFFEQLQRPANSLEISLLLRAETVSRRSECPYKIGVIVSQRNRIITEAVNQFKTHPKQKYWSDKFEYFPPTCHNYLHAEIAGIIQSPREDLVKSTMYIARTTKSRGSKRGSFPCYICFPAIVHAGIKKIVAYNTKCDPVVIDL